MKKTYKALIYTGSTETEAYKHNLFAVNGVLMLNRKIYLPNPGEAHTLADVIEAAEKLVKVETNGTGYIEWMEAKSYEAFKRGWLDIVGRPFN